jgi:endonuclease-8
VPEGDTIARTARHLHLALASRPIVEFTSVFPHLGRVDEDGPVRGRLVERVAAAGKHVLVHLSGDLTLRTHLRMGGSWHIYRRGERWRRPRSRMRIFLANDTYEAVAFDVYDARFHRTSRLDRESPVGRLGPDLSADTFDVGEALARMAASRQPTAADLLLDQRVVAGIGNVIANETLFLCGVHPARPPHALSPAEREALLAAARELLRLNGANLRAVARASEGRLTTRRLSPDESLWVYGRAGRACRRCGSPIAVARGVAVADLPVRPTRTSYWCPTCQGQLR